MPKQSLKSLRLNIPAHTYTSWRPGEERAQFTRPAYSFHATITIDEEAIERLAARASQNKSGKAKSGPVTVKAHTKAPPYGREV